MSIHEFPKKIELSEKEKLEREAINAKLADREIAVKIELITSATYFYMMSLMLEENDAVKMPDENSSKLASCVHQSIEALVSNFFGKRTDFEDALELLYDLKEELSNPPTKE